MPLSCTHPSKTSKTKILNLVIYFITLFLPQIFNTLKLSDTNVMVNTASIFRILEVFTEKTLKMKWFVFDLLPWHISHTYQQLLIIRYYQWQQQAQTEYSLTCYFTLYAQIILIKFAQILNTWINKISGLHTK
jgi:hypothetical protein